MTTYADFLAQSAAIRGHLCVGLDPDPRRTQPEDILAFNKQVISATADLAAAYKLNLAFYLAAGKPGWYALQDTILFIRQHAPQTPVIGDAKAGDVAHASQAWATTLYERLGCDAVTVNPYGGHDALLPFLERPNKGVYVWCHGSNPGAADFQNRPDPDAHGPEPLYIQVMAKAQEWNTNRNIGLVIGCNALPAIHYARHTAPELPLLLPGDSAQTADLTPAVQAAAAAGRAPYLVSLSRAIYYAAPPERSAEYTQAVHDAADRYRAQIRVAAASPQ